jgi:hypothetical protein
VTALTKEWSGLALGNEEIPRYEPVKIKPWGMIEAAIVDPDGNLLILGAPSEDGEL